MSLMDDPLDPCSINDPRRYMSGSFDLDVENNQCQMNVINFTVVDGRTANVAVLNQGMDPKCPPHGSDGPSEGDIGE